MKVTDRRTWWRTVEVWLGAGLGLALFLVALNVSTRGLPSPRKAYRNWTRGQDLRQPARKSALLVGVPLGLTSLFGVLNAGRKGPGYTVARSNFPSGLLGSTACVGAFLGSTVLLLGLGLITYGTLIGFTKLAGP